MDDQRPASFSRLPHGFKQENFKAPFHARGGLSVSCYALVFCATLLALFLTSPFSLTHRVLADEASGSWKRHHRGSVSLSPSSLGPQPIRALTIRPSTGKFLCPDSKDPSKRCHLVNPRSSIPLGPGSTNIFEAPNLLKPPQIPHIDINQPSSYPQFHVASALDSAFHAGWHAPKRYPFFTRSNSLMAPYMVRPGFTFVR